MIIGSKLYRTQSTDDSMGWAREHLHEAPDGAIFLADNYTKARGRQGRTWTVRPGQLMVTMVLKPVILKLLVQEDIPIRLNQLNMAICLGIQQALNDYGVRLKWPNDFVVKDKKLGGMLIQLAWEGGTPLGVIVGFGLNINNSCCIDPELEKIATSLKDTTGQEVVMRDIYKKILISIDGWYSLWQQLGFTTIYKSWRSALSSIGAQLTIHRKDGTSVSGKATQVMPNGDLMLEVNGKIEIIPFYQVEEVSQS